MPRRYQYLLIENQGEAPVEGYTVLGYSSTRNCGVEGTIGQFGSGSKHAINLCLRHGLPVWVYCGKTRLEFGLEREVLSDGLTEDTVYHVVYRKNGNGNFKRAGWVLDFGVLDWDNLGMALREFISNAIDRTLRENDGGLDSSLLKIKIVDDKERRAKSGTTRIYVALNEDVQSYFNNLSKYFLHFSSNPEDAKPGILSKAGRCPQGKPGAVIYREGVYVRTLEGTSLFDYNFSKDDIKIDECRNSGDYYVKKSIAQVLGRSDSDTLAEVFRAAGKELETIETELDQSYVFGSYGASPSETQEEIWARAWEAAAGPDAVVCDDQFSEDYVEKKGYNSQTAGAWGKSLRKLDSVKGADDILNEDERQGRTILEPTPDALKAVDWAWNIFNLGNLTGDKQKPTVKCFQEIAKAEHINSGFYKDGVVFIHVDIANDGQNNELKKTAVEELTHYITNATDNSRDFQNLLIDTIVNVCS